ncbi:MAG TPA: hypothetical protein VK434_01000 [Microvirga sp.]|jgi:hypothetical protein|nr:hypothetical protein [Microvirga sp.]
MTTRTSVGSARKLHLDRAARNAGEAFAFDEPEAIPSSHWSLGSTLLWLAIAGVAVVALSLAF